MHAKIIETHVKTSNKISNEAIDREYLYRIVFIKSQIKKSGLYQVKKSINLLYWLKLLVFLQQ